MLRVNRKRAGRTVDTYRNSVVLEDVAAAVIASYSVLNGTVYIIYMTLYCCAYPHLLISNSDISWMLTLDALPASSRLRP